MVRRGCFRVPLVLNAVRARDRFRFAVWTGDLGFVKTGTCVGLCISVAAWTAWNLSWYTLAEEGVVGPLGDGKKRWPICAKPKANLNLQKFSLPLIEYGEHVKWGRVTVRGAKEKRV
jgi:hypothetical protein